MEKASFKTPNEIQEKEWFEQLETLRKASWEAIASRRGVEWRVSIALWSIMAAFVALMVSVNPALDSVQRILLCLFPLITTIVYVHWLFMMFEAHNIDKAEEGDLREQMSKLAGYGQSEWVRTQVDKAKEARRSNNGVIHPITNTMHGPQIAMTVVLLAFSWGVVWTVPYKAQSSECRATVAKEVGH